MNKMAGEDDPPAPQPPQQQQRQQQQQAAGGAVQAQPPRGLRPDSFLPRKFDGTNRESTSSHYAQYEDYVLEHELDPATAIRRFRLTLSGEARDWISGKTFRSLKELKDGFISYFSGEHSKEARRHKWEEITLRKNESVEGFLSRLRPLAERLRKDEEDIQEKLTDCLKPHLEKQTLDAIVLMADGDLDQTIKLAQKSLDRKGMKEAREVTFASKEEVIVEPQEDKLDKLSKTMETLCIAQAEMKTKLENYENRGRSRQRRRSDSRSRSRNRRDSRDRSWNGRRRDRSWNNENDRRDAGQGRRDSRRDSRSRSRGRSESKDDRVCTWCFKKGHLIDRCFALEREKERRRAKYEKGDQDF